MPVAAAFRVRVISKLEVEAPVTRSCQWPGLCLVRAKPEPAPALEGIMALTSQYPEHPSPLGVGPAGGPWTNLGRLPNVKGVLNR
jgi:hypothetical protein